MPRDSDGRAFDDERPTGRIAKEQIEALVSRSLEKSTMFDAETALPVEPAPAAATPAPSGEYLAKGTAVLVLPEETVPPPVVEVVPVPPSGFLLPAPRAMPAAKPARRAKAAPAKARRSRPMPHVLKLALLTLAVACQPWWWNVGDVHPHAAASHPPIATP